MINEFGIEVQSTTYPTKQMEFNKWVQKFKVSSNCKKEDLDVAQINRQYNFSKIKLQFNDQTRKGS